MGLPAEEERAEVCSQERGVVVAAAAAAAAVALDVCAFQILKRERGRELCGEKGLSRQCWGCMRFSGCWKDTLDGGN